MSFFKSVRFHLDSVPSRILRKTPSRVFFFQRHHPSLKLLILGVFPLLFFLGCGSTSARYLGVERSLGAGDPQKAVKIIENAKDEYDSKSQLLYLMDRGMTLHLAAQYEESNTYLEQADDLVEDMYTKRITDEASAVLISDTELPYQGDPYEQIMINVVKALNYALLGNLTEALVEARRIDHRLNVLADSVEEDDYQEDPFARYLSGMLYEAFGDLNDAFIAYRKAEEGYQRARTWSGISMPQYLTEDLLRVTKALHLGTEYKAYRQVYPDVQEVSFDSQQLAHLVVLSYNGRGPQKKDIFLDLPISLDALQLVLIAKAGMGGSTQQTRVPEAVLYGVQGQIVRVALPQLVGQPSRIAYTTVRATNENEEYRSNTQRMYDVVAAAKKNLDDEYTEIAVRAVARAAIKMGIAEGVGYGAQAAVNNDSAQWVGVLVSIIAKIVAIATEEADTRTWRTLPGEIQVTRLWVKPGSYSVTLHSFDNQGRIVGPASNHQLTLEPGRTKFITQRLVF